MKPNQIEKAVQEADELMKHGSTLARSLTMTGLTLTQYHRHSSVPKVVTLGGSRIKARTFTLALQAARLIENGMTRTAALQHAGISSNSYKRAGVGPVSPPHVEIGGVRMRGATVEKARDAKRLIDAGLPALKACDRAGLSQASYRAVYPAVPPVADVQAFLDAVSKTNRQAA